MMNIQRLLTRDSICRKTRKWSLLLQYQMDQMWKVTKDSRYSNLQSNLVDDFCVVQTSASKYFRGKSKKTRDTWIKAKKKAIEKLHKKPFVEELLHEFHGKIILAGGSVFKAVLFPGRNTNEDLDFFFIDPNVENNAYPDTYTQLLLQVLTFLSNAWLFRHENSEKNNVYILRNEFVTTIHLVSLVPLVQGPNQHFNHPTCHKYQFIHRVYPSIGAVLGGFDLGPSMIAFTGKDIVSTEFGAYCAFSRQIIIDTSRRSTSYEHRIVKYSKMCHVIFPGLPKNLVCEEAENWKSEEEVNEILRSIIYSHGFVAEDTPHGYDFVKGFRSSEGEVLEKMQKVAAKRGFQIVNPSDIMLECTEKSEKEIQTTEELRQVLYKTCKENGCILTYEDFAVCMFNENNCYDGLSKRSSDYEDNPVWPCFAALINITAFSHGNFSAATSILVLQKYEGIQVINMFDEEWQKEAVTCLCGGIRTIVDIKETQQRILESFSSPYLGEIEESTNVRIREVNEYIYIHTKRKLYALFGSGAKNIAREPLLRERIHKNQSEANIRLQKVNWILKNPGRQWTSSNNPIIADPRDWYGPTYRSFRIGCEDVETTLRLIRKEKGSLLSLTDVNLFNYILRQVVWENSFLSHMKHLCMKLYSL